MVVSSVCACVRAFVRACVRACVRVCVCVCVWSGDAGKGGIKGMQYFV